jgi:hypothetical protein
MTVADHIQGATNAAAVRPETYSFERSDTPGDRANCAVSQRTAAWAASR